MDHIHVVKKGKEDSAEYTKPFYMELIGYGKPVDTAVYITILEALKEERIEETYIRLLVVQGIY